MAVNVLTKPKSLRAICDSGMDIRATPHHLPLWNPLSRISLLDPNFFFGLSISYFGPSRFCNSAVLNSVQSCTFPQNFITWLQSSVYTIHVVIIMYGLITLQFLAKCPYLSHNQHSVSPLFNCPNTAFVPPTDCSIYSAAELTINLYIYIYVYIYVYVYIYIYTNTYFSITYSSGLTVYNSQCTNSATHSFPLRQLLTLKCNDLLSPSNWHPL